MANQTPAAGHNLQTVSTDIKAAFARRYGIEQKMKAAVEPYKQDKKAVWDGLKTDTGMEAKDLQLAYKLYARDQEAKGFDEEDRIRVLDNLRIIFEGLVVGETVDFLDVLERAGGSARRTPPVTPKGAKAKARNGGKTPAPSDAYNTGYAAGREAKKNLDDNPYDETSAAFQSWQKGYQDGTFDNARKIKGAKSTAGVH